MPRIETPPPPPDALHLRYAAAQAYLDCYSTVTPRSVTTAQFIEAFYTSGWFRLERWILAWTVRKPSSDAQAAELARGERTEFAAWTVEARTPTQLLMCDYLGHTRSWLRTEPHPAGTRLYFGSVVTARVNPRTGARELGRAYRLLLGFHKLYSRVLLRAARARLER